MPKESLLLTRREMEVIDKRLKQKKLSQQDSNYLSRFVRPKLREMSLIDSRLLLKKLEYNQKIKAVENKVRRLILANMRDVVSITLYGSIVYSNYTSHKDIDVLVSVKSKFWKTLGEKYRLIAKIKNQAKGLNLDIKIYHNKDIYESYPTNITLIYELSDSKTIYGALEYPKIVHIDNAVLKFHMDYSYSILLDIKENGASGLHGKEIYSAIRNLWIIRFIMKKIVDNRQLIAILNYELGESMINSLKEGAASKAKKEMASIYLEELYGRTEKDIGKVNEEIKWERKQR